MDDGREDAGSLGDVLLTRLRQGDVVLLDVRPEAEYEAGHLPEAISIPIDELERRLAEQSGATLHLPAQNRATFPFDPIQDNDEFAIGAARLVALRTPGHTGESTCYLLDNQALFTGDTLFLTSVGRPDLEATAAESRMRAGLLYDALQQLLTFAPETLILSGHTSRPVAFDGQAIVASLAEVSQAIDLLHLPEETFIETILTRIPATPPNHRRIVELNEAGLWPDEDPTTVEAGANRCAVA